jgi:hypothetical protein
MPKEWIKDVEVQTEGGHPKITFEYHEEVPPKRPKYQKCYKKTGNVRKNCRYFGISPTTFYTRRGLRADKSSRNLKNTFPLR